MVLAIPIQPIYACQFWIQSDRNYDIYKVGGKFFFFYSIGVIYNWFLKAGGAFKRLLLSVQWQYLIKCITKSKFYLKFTKFVVNLKKIGPSTSKDKVVGLNEPYAMTQDQKIDLWFKIYQNFCFWLCP